MGANQRFEGLQKSAWGHRQRGDGANRSRAAHVQRAQCAMGGTDWPLLQPRYSLRPPKPQCLRREEGTHQHRGVLKLATPSHLLAEQIERELSH